MTLPEEDAAYIENTLQAACHNIIDLNAGWKNAPRGGRIFYESVAYDTEFLPEGDIIE